MEAISSHSSEGNRLNMPSRLHIDSENTSELNERLGFGNSEDESFRKQIETTSEPSPVLRLLWKANSFLMQGEL